MAKSHFVFFFDLGDLTLLDKLTTEAYNAIKFAKKTCNGTATSLKWFCSEQETLRYKFRGFLYHHMAARLLRLLGLLQNNKDLTPEQFLHDQLNEGKEAVAHLQNKIQEYETEEFSIADFVRQILVEIKSFDVVKQSGLIIAVDEAQVLSRICFGEIASETALASADTTIWTGTEIRSDCQRGLLTLVCASLRYLNISLVLAGTALRLGDADTIFSATTLKVGMDPQLITSFPICEDPWEMLGQVIDLSGCKPPSDIDLLKGRFRFTMAVVPYLLEILSSASCPTTKQEILNAAVKHTIAHGQMSIQKDITAFQNFEIRTGSDRRQRLYSLLNLMKFSRFNCNVAWTDPNIVDQLTKTICAVGIKIKSGRKETILCVQEPLVEQVLDANLKREFQDFQGCAALENLQQILQELGSKTATKGGLLEQLLAHTLLKFDGMLVSDLPFIKNNKDLHPQIGRKLFDWQNEEVRFCVKNLKLSENAMDDAEFLINYTTDVLLCPSNHTHPDLILNLSCSQTTKKHYGFSSALKFYGDDVPTETVSDNTASSDLHRCFIKKGRITSQDARNLFVENKVTYDGIVRLHIVLPKGEHGTPASCVKENDILVYIDLSNLELLFDPMVVPHANQIIKALREVYPQLKQ